MEQYQDIRPFGRLSAQERRQMEILIDRFVNAVVQKDIIGLMECLSSDGSYFDGLSYTETGAYFEEQFRQTIPDFLISHEADQRFCSGCNPGAPALRFHHGFWPVEKDNSPKAIMLEYQDGRISGLKICREFCTEERLRRAVRNN